ncbi:MAG: MATE family efflux transporter [Treponema sp.]|nr:MATE family efflux transporter [Treponema sp.]
MTKTHRHAGTTDLTQGNPARQILLFALPLVSGTLFQQLYSFADTIMVGRLIGTHALAAVGATYSLTFLILGFVQGATVGFGIPLAAAFGADAASNTESGEYKRFFWNGIWLCSALSLLLTTGTLISATPLLSLMRTPEDIFNPTLRYITIIFWGLPVSILYNFSASALRAAGDSKHPFYFLLLSGFLNIALDYVFIRHLKAGVAGAALATVISQTVSAGLNLWWLFFRTDLLARSRSCMPFSVSHIARLGIIGFPMGFEYCISALGAVVMQGAINTLGTEAVAGQTAGEKIRQMFTLPMESVGMAVATYAGQNSGARRFDRIKAGIRAGLIIQWSYCIVAWLIIFLGKGLFTRIVLGTTESTEALLSIRYLGIISTLFCLHGALMIMRNTLQGMGYSIHAVASGGGELLGRSLGSALSLGLIPALSLGFTGIALANPFAWGFALLYCTCMFRRVYSRNIKSA